MREVFAVVFLTERFTSEEIIQFQGGISMRKNCSFFCLFALCAGLSGVAGLWNGCSSKNIGTVSCDNGVAEQGEACDGVDLRGVTCESLGLGGGTIACFDDCSGFDTSGCAGMSECGNNIAETGELCDGDDLRDETCESLGLGNGVLACRADCSGYDAGGCGGTPVCGNDIAEEGELCDGADLKGGTCENMGLGEGTLACRADCSGYDVDGCSGAAGCGNSIAEEDEVCDGADLRGVTCEGLGYSGGALECLADCSGYVVSGCSVCGDGFLEADEVCDGEELDGETCETQGFYNGSLACLSDCSGYDTDGCLGYCGDGEINGEEMCDGEDLGGASCESLGYGGGDLGCLIDCSGYDTSGCSAAVFSGCDCVEPLEEDLSFAETIEICNPYNVIDIETYGDPDQMAVFDSFGSLQPRIDSTHDATGLLEDNCYAIMLCTGEALSTSPQSGTDFGNSDPHPLVNNEEVRDLGQIIFHLLIPSNVEAVSFDFMFLSSEYPEYVCTQFNDAFLAILEDPAVNGGLPSNISFDGNGLEFSISTNLFENPNEWTESLSGTGYDDPDPSVSCSGVSSDDCTVPDPCPPANNTIGSGTGWLRTYAPVTPGSDTILTFSIHDEADGILDSCVIIDNFRWLSTPVDSPFTVK